jgi:tetratricopeptide (TPR) repeat protein
MHAKVSWTSGIIAAALVGVSSCSPKPELAKDTGKIPVTTASAEARQDFLKGQELSDNIRFYDAHQLFASAVAKDSAFAMAWYDMALTAPTTSEFFAGMGRAVALAEKVSEGERLMILGLQSGVNGDPAKQRELYEQLVAKYPRDERAHALLGGAYGGTQDYAKAIEEYQKAVAIAPNYAPVYNQLGYAYRPLGNYAEAEKAFKKYIELIPGDPNPYDSYAELLLKMGRFEESIAMYRKALGVDPHFLGSLVGIADNYIYMGKPDSALAVTKEITAAARNDAERRTALFTTAVIQADQGKFDLALKALEQQHALAQGVADTGTMAADHDAMGDLMLEAGKPGDALLHYDQELTLIEASGFSEPVKENTRQGHHFNLARVALKKGDLATARAEAQTYLAAATARHNDFEVRAAHALAGQIALAEKRYDQALAELGQASQQDMAVLYRTGLAYEGKGDKAKSKELFTSAANFNTLMGLNEAFVRNKARAKAGAS